MNRKNLLAAFEKFLGNTFDNKYKISKDETHRWLFCKGLNDEDDTPFDCMCCITKPKYLKKWGVKCNCICHYRVGQIVDFFIRYSRKKGK